MTIWQLADEYEAETKRKAFIQEPGRVGMWASLPFLEWLAALVPETRPR